MIPCQFVCCAVGCLTRTAVTTLPCLQRDDFSDMTLVMTMRLRSNDSYRGIFARAHGHASRCLRQVRLNLAADANVGQFWRDTRCARAAASDEELKPPSHCTKYRHRNNLINLKGNLYFYDVQDEKHGSNYH